MDVAHYWEEHTNMQHIKYETCNSNDGSSRLKDERNMYPCCDGNLNFATAACSEDDSEYGSYKKNKVTRQDPMSHRIIEKRRRDRMNNCLADLSRLIPTEYLKKGRGRIEKTEIIEMAIKHMKYLQQGYSSSSEHYRLGYQECMSEAMRFMVEVEGHFPREAICVRLLSHLQKHCEAISRSGPPRRPPSADLINLHANQTDISVVSDHQIPKSDSEVSSNNNNNNSDNGLFTIRKRNSSESEAYEKYNENNGVSYKYKNDIKLRFNQDLNAVQLKRQKVDSERRDSATSLENHSSSHSSPPSSEVCTRISSENDNHRISPTESAISLMNSTKSEPNRTDSLQLYSTGNAKNNGALTPVDLKTNFDIPIFVLHSKGSFYVPLTIDYKTLLPFLHNYDLLEVLPNVHNIVLHPVTINVNFQPNYGVKSAKYPNSWN